MISIIKKVLSSPRELFHKRVREMRFEEIEQQIQRLQAYEKFISFGKMSMGVFHDLSSPLTALLLTIERLRRSTHALPEKIEGEIGRLTKISTTIERFLKTIQNSYKDQSVCTMFCINTLIHDICEMLSHKSTSFGVDMVFYTKERIITEGNYLRLQHVITNIISNALDAMEDADRRNKRLKIITKRGSLLSKIHVIDNGIGMNTETVSKIFEPFFTTKPAHAGAGIGLCQSQEIIQKEFGGNISVKSQVGKGTIFTITLKS